MSQLKDDSEAEDLLSGEEKRQRLLSNVSKLLLWYLTVHYIATKLTIL